MNALVALGAFVMSAMLAMLATRALIGRLTTAAVFDRPSARGLHDRIVPRGGGLALAAVTLVAQAVLVLGGYLPVIAGAATLALGAGYAWIGWRDDRASRSVRERLILQSVLAVLAVWAWWPRAGFDLGAGVLGVIAVLALMWHVNLCNFMDGADGFAATHALLASVAIASLCTAREASGIVVWALAFGGASAGFLRWNWSPARIFLGDAGSYFIGYSLAALAVAACAAGVGAAALAIVLAPFVVDASATLAVRIAAGHAPWRAHRTHVYQRLVLAGWSPARLCGALAAFEIGLCWPAAWWAESGAGAWLAGGVYGLVVIIWAWTRAAHPTP